MPEIKFNISTGNVNELKGAIDHHIGTDATDGWGNAEYLAWVKARVRSQVKQLVLKYRESAQPATDTTDPTAN